MQAVWKMNPDVAFKRAGNSLKEKTIISPGQEYNLTFILNEVKNWKEGDNFHWQACSIFVQNDGEIKLKFKVVRTFDQYSLYKKYVTDAREMYYSHGW